MATRPSSNDFEYPLKELQTGLNEILITEELSVRPQRLPRSASENKALRTLAAIMANDPERLPDALLQYALELCNAGTAGLSLLETTPTGAVIFRWTNLAGRLKDSVGGFTPREFSPCGVVLDRKAAQLFIHPERHFQYFASAGVPFVEALVVPLAGENPLGTIWILSHDDRTHFDAEDLRIMTSLAEFTSSALRMIQLLNSERGSRQEAEAQLAKRIGTENILRESEEFNRRILESGSDCIKVLDLDYHIKYMSPVAMKLMEVDDFSQCNDANWVQFWETADRAAVLAALDAARAGGKGFFQALCPTLKGTPKWWDVAITPIKNAEGQVVKLLSSSRDVTGRKAAEAELKQAHDHLEKQVRERTAELEEQVVERNCAEANLRELTGRLLRLRDDEQRRLARELHDSVGQMLAAISMNIAVALAEKDLSPKARRAVTQNSALIDQISTEIRTISHLLHPPLLDEVGLASGLRWYLEQFAARSKTKVALQLDEDFGRLPSDLETAIFRLVQESLTNVHWHSESPTASVRVARSADEVILEVSDEGNGIPQQKIWEIEMGRASGVGLSGMRERVRQMGGKFEISSSGQGTIVSAKFPIAKVSENAPPLA
ncbi:MAG: PAS domain-containing protein [Terriglobales bacterium]